MNMYLDMVNTTGGAIAWAFLKPMLMGEILYTPDTPITRGIMEKVYCKFSIDYALYSSHTHSQSCSVFYENQF